MNERVTLTNADLLMIFSKDIDDARWIASADSREYLAVVLYLVQTRYNTRTA